MVILLLFNKFSNWTIERLQDETQIKTDLFLQIICGLLKSRLIICSEISEDQVEDDLKETDIKMHYMIKIAEDFKRLVFLLVYFLRQNL